MRLKNLIVGISALSVFTGVCYHMITKSMGPSVGKWEDGTTEISGKRVMLSGDQAQNYKNQQDAVKRLVERAVQAKREKEQSRKKSRFVSKEKVEGSEQALRDNLEAQMAEREIEMRQAIADLEAEEEWSGYNSQPKRDVSHPRYSQNYMPPSRLDKPSSPLKKVDNRGSDSKASDTMPAKSRSVPASGSVSMPNFSESAEVAKEASKQVNTEPNVAPALEGRNNELLKNGIVPNKPMDEKKKDEVKGEEKKEDKVQGSVEANNNEKNKKMEEDESSSQEKSESSLSQNQSEKSIKSEESINYNSEEQSSYDEGPKEESDSEICTDKKKDRVIIDNLDNQSNENRNNADENSFKIGDIKISQNGNGSILINNKEVVKKLDGKEYRLEHFCKIEGDKLKVTNEDVYKELLDFFFSWYRADLFVDKRYPALSERVKSLKTGAGECVDERFLRDFDNLTDKHCSINLKEYVKYVAPKIEERLGKQGITGENYSSHSETIRQVSNEVKQEYKEGKLRPSDENDEKEDEKQDEDDAANDWCKGRVSTDEFGRILLNNARMGMYCNIVPFYLENFCTIQDGRLKITNKAVYEELIEFVHLFKSCENFFGLTEEEIKKFRKKDYLTQEVFDLFKEIRFVYKDNIPVRVYYKNVIQKALKKIIEELGLGRKDYDDAGVMEEVRNKFEGIYREQLKKEAEERERKREEEEVNDLMRGNNDGF